MGVLDWLFRRKGEEPSEILDRPFPRVWREVLLHNVSYYRRITPEQRQLLEKMVQTFVAEKEFIAHAGAAINDEVKVTIAGMACILLLGIPHLGVYPRLREIIVHLSDFGQVVDAVGPDGRRYAIPQMHVGEAWRRGPVVLAWDTVRHSVASAGDGYNVVFHEFAHVLDMAKGHADGTPPLESKEQYEAWSRVFNAEFKAFVEASRRGQPTFLDPYGASEPSEFFAVVTEHFFEQPREMKLLHPELYEQFQGFYRQDPAKWPTSRTGHWRKA